MELNAIAKRAPGVKPPSLNVLITAYTNTALDDLLASIARMLYSLQEAARQTEDDPAWEWSKRVLVVRVTSFAGEDDPSQPEGSAPVFCVKPNELEPLTADDEIAGRIVACTVWGAAKLKKGNVFDMIAIDEGGLGVKRIYFHQ